MNSLNITYIHNWGQHEDMHENTSPSMTTTMDITEHKQYGHISESQYN